MHPDYEKALREGEGWALISARYVAGYSGSASGKEHYFRHGRSLCGKATWESIQLPSLGLKMRPASSSCGNCSKIHKREGTKV